MGRSRGGLTSKIHAVVDTNGMPVHLALTPGEAHDNRLCSVLLSTARAANAGSKAISGIDLDVARPTFRSRFLNSQIIDAFPDFEHFNKPSGSFAAP